MNLTVNPAVDPGDMAVLLLGGVEFRLATLVARQNRKITPKLADVIAIVNRRSAALRGVRLGNDGFPELAPDELVEKQRALALSEPEWDMLIDFVAVGLTRCHPAVTRDDLLDLPITAEALLAAVDAVAAASQMVRKAAEDAPAGGAGAASQ